MKRLNVEALRAKAIAQFNASNDLKERFLDGETFANVVVRETREKLASEEPNTPIDSFEQLETGWMARLEIQRRQPPGRFYERGDLRREPEARSTDRRSPAGNLPVLKGVRSAGGGYATAAGFFQDAHGLSHG